MNYYNSGSYRCFNKIEVVSSRHCLLPWLYIRKGFGKCMNVLLCGPDYYMEMGWRLMRYQGIIRAMAPMYDKTVVITNEFGIYKDFAEDASTAHIGDKSMWKAMGAKITRVEPSREFCCNPKAIQKFHRYRVHEKGHQIITIHARNRKVGANRNWSKENWDELVMLLHKQGFVVASIGTDVMDIAVDIDYRNVTFGQLCTIIATSKLVVGPSSGPMHIASIIGTPHVVWSHKGKQNLGEITGTNRERYETVWNPFQCKVRVIDEYGWQPTPKVVLAEINKVER